jgi:AcrR family transcriptional regulator
MPQQPPAGAARSRLDHLVDPPIRADARRNYDALLVAADELFTTIGPGVALDEIARRAGVGNATLYRHFPDRRDLLIAVCVSDVQALCTLAEQLEAAPDPGQAFTRWLRAYVTHVSSRSGLAAAFATDRRDDSEFVAACQSAVAAAGTALLERAQSGGAIRGDVAFRDVITLVNAIAQATETADEREADRMLAIVLVGIAERPNG